MAFGLNRAEVIGRLGADVSVNHLTSGGKVANGTVRLTDSILQNRFLRTVRLAVGSTGTQRRLGVV